MYAVGPVDWCTLVAPGARESLGCMAGITNQALAAMYDGSDGFAPAICQGYCQQAQLLSFGCSIRMTSLCFSPLAQVNVISPVYQYFWTSKDGMCVPFNHSDPLLVTIDLQAGRVAQCIERSC